MVAQTGQPYAFTGGDPLNEVDPLGLSWYNPSWAHKVIHKVAHVADKVRHATAHIAKNAVTEVNSHWRGLAHGALVGTAIVGGIACAVATAGVCGAMAGALTVTLAGGAVEGVAAHALDGDNQTLEGYLASAGTGSLQEASSLIPEELFFGAEARHATPMGFVPTLRNLFHNF
jgi:hypothetical protein